jgi:thioredoxin reductase (NADPH)
MSEQVIRTETIVIGGGPAGLTAALYLARDQTDTILLEKAQPGGQVIITDRVENYPGFPEGISGPQLMERLTDQVKRFGARIETESEVTRIESEDSLHRVVAGERTYVAPYVVIASGSDYRKLEVAGSEELTGHGISYCAICDAAFYKGKTIAVVGGGSSAVDEANFLTKFVDHIYLIQRSDRLGAEQISIDRLRQNGKVEVFLEHEVQRVLGDKVVTGVEVLDRRAGQVKRIDVQGVFVFIGRVPNSGFARGYVLCDEEGFIQTPVCSVETSRVNVFAAGDVRAGNRAQITTAVGDGTIAAFFIRERLEAAKKS